MPVSTLRASPFSIQWGSSIYARIIATNNLGSSLPSQEGNGAIILNYPDEPINLANNEQVTWGTRIGLTWDEGDSNGGAPVLDYTIMSKASDSDSFVEYQVGVVGTSATLEGFTFGITYTFKVKARNAFGFSVAYSNTVSILAATEPDQPLPPTTSIVGDSVQIDWIAPSDNGNAIQSYTITIRQYNLIYSE